MQNIVQGTTSDSQKSHEKQSAAPAPPAATNFHYETGKTNSSPTKSETETFSEHLSDDNERGGQRFRGPHHTNVDVEIDIIILVLLAMNANVEDSGIKGTPLMEAAIAGHVDMVKLWIAQGADVNAQSTLGNTPLMYGCAGGHEEVVRVLLKAGANLEDHNENGHTPLMIAAREGYMDVATVLLEHGAKTREVKAEAYPLLKKATRKDDVRSAILLIKSEANIEDPF